jgi:hypothetical protein
MAEKNDFKPNLRSRIYTTVSDKERGLLPKRSCCRRKAERPGWPQEAIRSYDRKESERMRATSLLFAGLACLAGGLTQLSGEELIKRERFERDGKTYESSTYRKPVLQQTVQEQQQTVYVDRRVTEMYDSQRTLMVPVTQMVYEPRVHNWWNPFTGAHVAYHLVPRTRWEMRTEIVRSPIERRELVPEQRIVQRVVNTPTFVEEARIVEVQPSGAPTTQVATRSIFQSLPATALPNSGAQIGGIQRNPTSLR